MMYVSSLPGIYRDLLAFWSMLLLYPLFYRLLLLLWIRESRVKILQSILPLCAALLLWYRISFAAPAAVPWLVPAACLMVLSVIAIRFLVESRHAQAEHITRRSIRESFDNLPSGLCYYWPGGLPKLINRRMDAVRSPDTRLQMRNSLPGS